MASRVTHSPVGVQGSRISLRRLLGAQESGLLIANVVLFAVLGVTAPGFLTGQNFRSTAELAAYTGIMSAVETLVLISGGLDLSVGSVAVLSGQAGAIALNDGWSTAAAICAVLALGVGVGIVNSAFVVGLGINPLIATIGTGFVFRGIAQSWTSGNSTALANQTVLNFGSAIWYGVPEGCWLMLATFLVVWLIFRYTRFGSNLFAIGSSLRAARRSGLAVRRIQSMAYILSGMAASFAGLVLIGFQGVSIPFASMGIELTVLTAVILGGTGLAGGTGSVFGTLLGVILLAGLASGLLELSAPSYWQLITTGLVLAVAMTIDDVRRRRREMRG